MAVFSDYTENKLIDHLLRTATFSKPSTVAVALCTAAPTDASTGATIAEVPNSNNYSRQTINPSDSNWTATQGGTSGASSGTSGETANAVAIEFPVASGPWGLVTHVAVLDSATHGAGNMLFYFELPDSRTVISGKQAIIDAGDMTLRLRPCPTYDCISGDCVDPEDGTGQYATLTECQDACTLVQFVQDSRGLDFLGSGDGNLMGSTISGVEEGSLLVIFIETTEETAFMASHTVTFKREPATPVVFTLAGEIENNTDPHAGNLFTNRLQAYYFENAPAGDYTVTITMTYSGGPPAGRYAVWDFLEYRGVATSGALFAETENSGNDESPTVAAPARNGTSDLIVAAYGTRPMSQDAQPTLTSSGWTARWLHNPTFQVTMGIADYVRTSAAPDAAWTLQMHGADDYPWNAIALSFKAAP